MPSSAPSLPPLRLLWTPPEIPGSWPDTLTEPAGSKAQSSIKNKINSSCPISHIRPTASTVPSVRFERGGAFGGEPQEGAAAILGLEPGSYGFFQPAMPVALPVEDAALSKPPEMQITTATPVFDSLGIPLAPIPTGRIHFEPPKFGPDGSLIPLAPAISLAPGLEWPTRAPQIGTSADSYAAPKSKSKRGESAHQVPEERESRQAYEERRKFAQSLIRRLPMDTRKLFCVAEFFKHMEQGKLKKQEAFRAAGESAGTSTKSAMSWVEDFTARGDGTFSESKRGKHAKSPWLLSAPHLQARALEWLKQQTSEDGGGKKNASLSRAFQDYCNTELLTDSDVPKAKKRKKDAPEDEDASDDSRPRRISQKTARTWLQKLGYDCSKAKGVNGETDNDIDEPVIDSRLPGVDDVQHLAIGQQMHDPEDLPLVQSHQSLREQLQ